LRAALRSTRPPTFAAAAVARALATHIALSLTRARSPFRLSPPARPSVRAALPSVRTFAFDAPSFWRESAAGVSPWAFYASRALADVPPLALRALVFALVFWSAGNLSIPFSTLVALLVGNMFAASGTPRRAALRRATPRRATPPVRPAHGARLRPHAAGCGQRRNAPRLSASRARASRT
jgi:hypothetical protein